MTIVTSWLGSAAKFRVIRTKIFNYGKMLATSEIIILLHSLKNVVFVTKVQNGKCCRYDIFGAMISLYFWRCITLYHYKTQDGKCNQCDAPETISHGTFGDKKNLENAQNASKCGRLIHAFCAKFRFPHFLSLCDMPEPECFPNFPVPWKKRRFFLFPFFFFFLKKYSKSKIWNRLPRILN